MYLESSLLNIEKVRHAFFTRNGGVSSGIYQSLNCGYGSNDKRIAIKENRKRALAVLGASDDNLCTLDQVHSNTVITIDGKEDWSHDFRADGLVTNTPGIVLGILTADCAPVLLIDSKTGVIGALHAGWRGALGGIIQSCVSSMLSLGARVHNLHVTIGPCIGYDSYEVGPDFSRVFLQEDPANETFFRQSIRQDHYLFDLQGYIRNHFIKLGVLFISSINRDTYLEENNFFSYRRNSHRGQKDYGRLLSAITME